MKNIHIFLNIFILSILIISYGNLKEKIKEEKILDPKEEIEKAFIKVKNTSLSKFTLLNDEISNTPFKTEVITEFY
jgi:hypothetical protein